ncbi:hypothetical protein ACO22_03170 [Paracoccidioides brasiliensis]|uniref:Uncharacterized protein n=1 Tax=Paracoccidioides brasiliensis TaxID=121759 RepID=A0A1D2JGL9_PARBR|nr:hypothetical protein ACO22_03170 [Paracoccidioides brasiliensis]ODH46586.1 hypothetical protein GX48_07325 [Paracoccidioides brasiliensis]
MSGESGRRPLTTKIFSASGLRKPRAGSHISHVKPPQVAPPTGRPSLLAEWAVAAHLQRRHITAMEWWVVK